MEAAENSWRPLGELLVAKELITKDELDRALAEQADTGRLLGAILVERGFVSGPALAIALAEQHGVELNQERGFGTGLWAEIDKRHRAARGHTPEELERENVVRLEPAKPPPLEVVPDSEPDPELEELQAENRRLQAEIERLHGEFTKLSLVEQETEPEPEAAAPEKEPEPPPEPKPEPPPEAAPRVVPSAPPADGGLAARLAAYGRPAADRDDERGNRD